MESRVIDELTLFFPPAERAAAELIGRACTAGIPLIGNSWGVRAPKDVRVYVVNSSWLRALYARGYWRTRYLEETRPGLLRDVLAQPRPHDWERTIATACQADDQSFWPALDAALTTHFDQPAKS